jgi:S1-C subfamily serine protease
VYFRSGIRQNDILVSVDGRTVRNDADFYAAVRPGARVPVIILRDGRRETIYIESPQLQTYGRTPQTIPSDLSLSGGRPYLGIAFAPNARGAAIVRSVTPASPAEEAGLQAGDAIVAINNESVRSSQDAISIVGSMQPGDRVLISFERQMQSETEAVLAGQPGRSTRTAASEFDRGVEQSSASVLVEENRAYDNRNADVEVDVESDVRDRRDYDNRDPDDPRGGILNRNRNNNQRRGIFN